MNVPFLSPRSRAPVSGRVGILRRGWLACAVAAASALAAAAPVAAASPTQLRTPLNLAHHLAAATPAPTPTSAAARSSAAAPSLARPALSGWLTQATSAKSGFVSASGVNLMLSGQQWRFVGYDDYRLTSTQAGFNCGWNSDSELGTMLDEVHTRSGATVVRTWFMQSYGGPGRWSEFDRVLAAAAARNMKVIPVLTDQWGACELWPTDHYRPLSWYQSGYLQPDPGNTLSFKAFAAAMAAHYAGNSTITFWQLVNEAEAKDSSNGACQEALANQAMRSFADNVAGAMKAVDHNHLVSLGTIGSGQCGSSGSADYKYVHAGLIDICEYHNYQGGGPLPGDQWNGVAVRINDCLSLGKPIFAGEVGIDASSQANGSSSGIVTPVSLQQRATFFKEQMTTQFAMGLSGYLIWEYTPGADTGVEIAAGDPTEAVMTSVASSLVPPRYG